MLEGQFIRMQDLARCLRIILPGFHHLAIARTFSRRTVGDLARPGEYEFDGYVPSRADSGQYCMVRAVPAARRASPRFVPFAHRLLR